MKLVIVESPAKAKTIAKYLGKDYTVEASRGHILDLPEKSMGVDIDNNYTPHYAPKTKDQKDTIAKLKALVKKSSSVYLATDPDREGEAISWHLQMALNLDPNDCNRITFNEISNKAVNKAVSNPSQLNMNLVNAQQARRVLDRLVGYTLSPVLCKKLAGKLSAGRVQSATLSLVVDREKQIASFVAKEYWTVNALLRKDKSSTFTANLVEVQGTKIDLDCQSSCQEVLDRLSGAQYVVDSVKKSVTSSKPLAPFTTSTLQQDAVNKLRMPSRTTMQVAQQLYEGIDISGMGHVALVTYIRTDSVRVSSDAIQGARDYLAMHYGEQYVPSSPNYYTSKKSAQDAHEAIRPINLDMSPDKLKPLLQPNQYKLYKLIYERFLASQSTKATYNSVNVSIMANQCKFTVTGRTLIFDGYTAIYGTKSKDDDSIVKLPSMEVGDVLKLEELVHEQKFTKPPARYTEASLIKMMEECGIGRPSTYSATIATLYKREYVLLENKAMHATELGQLVTEYLREHFHDVVDVEFTADMEDRLDSIEDDSKLWYDIVDQYYRPLKANVDKAMGESGVNLPVQETDEKCDKCGSPMVIKTGRYGKYLACTNVGNCTNNKSLKTKVPPKETEEKCEKCGAMMLLRQGKNGEFLACSNYPKCKNTKSMDKAVAKCPKCGKDVFKRMSKKGKVFYGCSGYPKCDFAVWDMPTGELCPTCNSVLVVKGDNIVCTSKTCNYTQPYKGDNSES